MCVFDTAAVEINLHPVVGNLLGKGFMVVERIGVAQEIPGIHYGRSHTYRSAEVSLWEYQPETYLDMLKLESI